MNVMRLRLLCFSRERQGRRRRRGLPFEFRKREREEEEEEEQQHQQSHARHHQYHARHHQYHAFVKVYIIPVLNTFTRSRGLTETFRVIARFPHFCISNFLTFARAYILPHLRSLLLFKSQ